MQMHIKILLFPSNANTFQKYSRTFQKYLKSTWKKFQMQMQILFIWRVQMQMQILFKSIWPHLWWWVGERDWGETGNLLMQLLVKDLDFMLSKSIWKKKTKGKARRRVSCFLWIQYKYHRLWMMFADYSGKVLSFA